MGKWENRNKMDSFNFGNFRKNSELINLSIYFIYETLWENYNQFKK